jgi:hypothetical protein
MPELTDLLGSIQQWEIVVTQYPLSLIAQKFAELAPTVYDQATLDQLQETIVMTILRVKGPLAVAEFRQELQKRM